MAGFMKNAMSYLGMTDVVDDDDPVLDEEPAESSFDSDHSVTPMTSNASSGTSGASRESSTSPFPGRVSRITTIHPKTYDEAQMVGRALRDGVPGGAQPDRCAGSRCLPDRRFLRRRGVRRARLDRTGDPARVPAEPGEHQGGRTADVQVDPRPVLGLTAHCSLSACPRFSCRLGTCCYLSSHASSIG